MSNNPKIQELEAELLRFEIDRLAAEADMLTAESGARNVQAELLQLQLEELEEQNREDQGPKRLDDLVADIVSSIQTHPAGGPRRAAATADDEIKDPRLKDLHLRLKEAGFTLYGTGHKPQTLEELGQAVRESDVFLVPSR